MSTTSRWQQLGGDAVKVYQRRLAPAVFVPWAPHLLDQAALHKGIVGSASPAAPVL